MTNDQQASTAVVALDFAVDCGAERQYLVGKTAFDLVSRMVELGLLPDDLESRAPAYNAAIQWKNNKRRALAANDLRLDI